MTSREAPLSKILEQLPVAYTAPENASIIVTGIALDSRAVVPGDLFVSLVGASVDGHDFIPQAIRNGAAAVAGEKPLRKLEIPYVQLASARGALSWIAAAFYDFPGRKMRVIGVTGTDGKTTTTNLIYQILRAAGIKAGMISTVNALIGDEQLDTGFHVTTPDAHDVQRFMARMVDAGLTHAILETTSHGWAQHRVDACEFDIGVVTNITHEHLDQHGSYENYRAAKARLFTSLEQTHPKQGGGSPLAIINRDDSSYDYLEHLIRVGKLSYGFSREARLRALDVVAGSDGTSFTAASGNLRVDIFTSLQGDYNVSNCLAALAATILGLGIEPKIAARGIREMKGVPGRMERIQAGQEFVAMVDFAHTPNALKVTLEAARRLVQGAGRDGRLIVVFGCAGLRDREKRRMMAETASELADLTVLTAEDPRTESLHGILAEMADGAKAKGGREGETFWRMPDRGDALRFATRLARAQDLVLSCGKGHEQSMCFGSREFPWDDRVAMCAALAELLRVEGPGMPYLPTSDKTEDQWLPALR